MESVKFTFDDDFSADGGGGTYTNKMQKLNDDAFADGKEHGYNEALQSLEKNCETILESIKDSLAVITSRHEEQVVAMEKNATALVLTIVQKLAPALVAEKPIKEIEQLVQECLRNNPLEPRMVIRVDEKMLPLLRKRIDTLQTASDYNGQIVLISDTMANVSDCRVEWIDGGAERDFEGLMKSIEETVQIFIDAPIMTENTVDDQEMPEIGLDQFPENQST
tara:strand:+ start:13346 stop:14011 length:666 start_codon:yes stop_codon:yes gene_type:complete